MTRKAKFKLDRRHSFEQTIHPESFEAGFERACLLIIGNKVSWTSQERRLFNKVSRKLFGKKRK